MNVVDSSAWLEYLTGSERAELFAEPIESTDSLIVPVMSSTNCSRKFTASGVRMPRSKYTGCWHKAQSWISIHPWRWLLRASGFLWPAV